MPSVKAEIRVIPITLVVTELLLTICVTGTGIICALVGNGSVSPLCGCLFFFVFFGTEMPRRWRITVDACSWVRPFLTIFMLLDTQWE